ncbi:hypothetical protein CTAYLR_003124 [Chrysophaeum taylorii]|uniref:Uncharacterized protein n=1 Tax=Chrysophaeum taylorii TaxID=2483200 RepID=A0AAD7XRS6_9STRA|nr:hypothetical protein CTAYLR_003124 [Chrysophaeum taylorii]
MTTTTTGSIIEASSPTKEEFSGIFDLNGEQVDRPDVARKLREPIPLEKLRSRPGPGGQTVTYMEAGDVFEAANKIFGYNGWGSRVKKLMVDWIDMDDKQTWCCHASAIAFVYVKPEKDDGHVEEDGCASLKGKDRGEVLGHEEEGCASLKGKDRGEVLGNCKKAAVTDAKKRALRVFGDALGNMCYSKEKMKKAKKEQQQKPAPPKGPTSKATNAPTTTTKAASEEKRRASGEDLSGVDVDDLLKSWDDVEPAPDTFDLNGEQPDVARKLQEPIPLEKLQSRPGPGGQKVIYVEACDVFEAANRIFGYNGWGSRLLDVTFEMDGKQMWCCDVTAKVWVFSAGGKDYGHEDIGCASLKGKDRGELLGNCKKAAVTDAKKRALRLFGDALGNMCYSKEKMKEAKKGARHHQQQQQRKPAPPPPRGPSNKATIAPGPPTQAVLLLEEKRHAPRVDPGEDLAGVDVDDFFAYSAADLEEPPAPKIPRLQLSS